MTHLVGPDGTLQPLLTLTRVGRGPENELRLDHPRVSRAHAQVVWDGFAWCLYDLGSRNGTTRNGAVLHGGRPRIFDGDVLSFAGQGPWRLAGEAPPRPFALGPDGRLLEPTDGLLGIPDDVAPILWLTQLAGDWYVEWFDGRRALLRGQRVLPVAGQVWRIGAPEPTAMTWDPKPGEADEHTPDPGAASRLQLQHSANEESIELTVWAGGRSLHLGHRAHNALLLQLARAQAAHRPAFEGLPNRTADSQPPGWVYPEILEAELGVSRQQLNMLVYRARRQLVEAGIDGGAQAIARQPGTAALRLQWPTVVQGPDGVAWQTDPPLRVPPDATEPPWSS